MMARYSEADDLSAGGRVASMRVDVAPGPAGARLVPPDVIDLREVREHKLQEPVLLADPVSAVPQQERRAVGRTLRVISHGFDAAALASPLILSGAILGESIPLKVIALFAVVGTVLLWPTSRRGRLVVVPSEGLLSVVGRVGLAPVVTLIIFYGFGMGHLTSTGRSIDVFAIVQIVAATIPLILIGRLISYQLAGLVRSRGYDLDDTLIVGTGPVGVEVARALRECPEFGLVPTGFVDRFDDEDLPLPIVGRPEHLPEILDRTGARHVILAFGAAGEAELVSIIRDCQDRTVQFYAVPRLFELGVSHEDVGHEVDGLPLVPVRRPGAASSTWRAKRAFDVVVSSLLLILASPLLLACAIGVKLSSRGPVFFRQVRIGIGGKPFEILKFRTMRVNDDSATRWCVDDDDRVTRIGRFLRPSHLDELPQLFNVLRGEMSLVGPRPERPHFVEQFGSEIDGYHFRHRVPVGITGWAQVHGYWGDTSIETRVRLDNRYIENWSLWRDLVIGLRTIPTLLGKRR
jgi:exopolysaccharide biosynthesis polyprenyl glycosylphosphotransferase